MKKLLSTYALSTALSSLAFSMAYAQSGDAAIPGGDQFVRDCAAQIPGGDQFDPGAVQIDDELPEGIPGGDQFGREAIPGGDQFSKECLKKIPGGDQFDPGEIKIDDELPEGIPGGDQFDPKAIPDGDQFDPAGGERSMTDDAKVDDKLPEGEVVPVLVPDGCNWTGAWGSTYGILRLIQKGAAVAGDYSTKGFIEGRIGADCSLKGSFDNRKESLKGHFSFERDGEKFEGEWGLNGEPASESWKGRRSSKEVPELRADELWTANCDWTGTWFTPWTGVRMRLVQDGDKVYGELGERETIEGTTRTECAGNRDIRLQAMLKDRETGATRSMTITMTDRRYIGTIGGGGSGLPSSNIMSGSRASRDTPELAFAKAPTPISDAGETKQLVGIPGELNEEAPLESNTKNNIARWEVNLGEICAARISGGYEIDSIFGISWVKARIFNKKTGKEIELAPVGGFPNVNGDKERAWELLPNPENGVKNYLYENKCSKITKKGVVEEGVDSIKLTFEVDAAAYGYKDIEELLNRRRNRIRVMYKIGRTQNDPNRIFGASRSTTGIVYGDKAKTIPLIEADVCGLCKSESWRKTRGSAPSGDGVFSGFSSKYGDNLFVLYDIKRIDE